MTLGALRRAGFYLLVFVGVMLLALPSKSAAAAGKIIYIFPGGADGSNPMSDLTLDAAENLYGTTSQGGSNSNCGTVFELIRNQNGWKHQVLYSFSGTNGDSCFPEAGLPPRIRSGVRLNLPCRRDYRCCQGRRGQQESLRHCPQ